MPIIFQIAQYCNTLTTLNTCLLNNLLILRITFWQMIYSQRFHQILYFTSENFILFWKFQNFWKNIFSVKLALVLQYLPPPKKKTLRGFNLQLLSRQLCSFSLSRKPGNGSELRIINQGRLVAGQWVEFVHSMIEQSSDWDWFVCGSQ